MREINLSGGEITVLKAIGSSATDGKQLISRVRELESAELVDTLQGLIMMGYVLCDASNIREMEEIERSSFRMNPSYGRELKEALDPRPKQDTSRRRRRG